MTDGADVPAPETGPATPAASPKPAPKDPPRGVPVGVDDPDGSALTRALLIPFRGLGLVLRPAGFAFRIREPVPVVLRATLPLVLVVAIIALWHSATTGQRYLGSFPSLSPLDQQKADLERAFGTTISVVTTRFEKKSWASPEKKVYSQITAIELPKATFDARKKVVDELLGADQFTATTAGDKVRLDAHSHFGQFEVGSEWDKARTALEAAGLQLVVRPNVVEGAGTANERVVSVVERATVAAVTTAVRDVLDQVLGPDAYVVKATSVQGAAIEGTEKIETRKVSPALLPSPHEMLDALPSLLNSQWSTWEDARHWWKVGDPERSTGAPATPVALDWKKPNEVPFQLATRFFERTIGPRWKDWTLLQAIVWSTIRILMGFFYAAIVAVPLGVIMGSFTKPRIFFEPVRLMGAYLPLPAFLTLTVFWWGTTESQKIGFLAICTFVVLLPQIVMAVEAVPQTQIDVARTLGATRWHQMRYVLLAGSKHEIMRSLRLSFAVGWTWIILAEMINPIAGLGYVIQLGERRADHRPHIYAVILAIVVLAFLVNSTWAWVERKLYPYRDAEVS